MRPNPTAPPDRDEIFRLSLAAPYQAVSTPRARPVVVVEAALHELAKVDRDTGTIISRNSARIAMQFTSPCGCACEKAA